MIYAFHWSLFSHIINVIKLKGVCVSIKGKSKTSLRSSFDVEFMNTLMSLSFLTYVALKLGHD